MHTFRVALAHGKTLGQLFKKLCVHIPLKKISFCYLYR